MIEMTLIGVRVELPGNQPIVLLKEREGERYLPIWIGTSEATAIAFALQGVVTARPMTHDLMKNLLEELGVDVQRIRITELREGTFYASIDLSRNGSAVEVSSRPSDAIALAVRVNAPIYAAEEVLDQAGAEQRREPRDRHDVGGAQHQGRGRGDVQRDPSAARRGRHPEDLPEAQRQDVVRAQRDVDRRPRHRERERGHEAGPHPRPQEERGPVDGDRGERRQGSAGGRRPGAGEDLGIHGAQRDDAAGDQRERPRPPPSEAANPQLRGPAAHFFASPSLPC